MAWIAVATPRRDGLCMNWRLGTASTPTPSTPIRKGNPARFLVKVMRIDCRIREEGGGGERDGSFLNTLTSVSDFRVNSQKWVVLRRSQKYRGARNAG